ncbi:NTP transferase domain-containing protein [Natronosalvus halobius]|uniref:NTP transferase domain-containing protein n=1 Tax=Natronosalvus halobius TaxID=2953746 RepID=UPI00209D3C8A|nr:NTP transferase domain-containing protein [Natronosalvus halobius]USZ71456.1 NTP transferase domain-containing protein [Natronosalvus halobius]
MDAIILSAGRGSRMQNHTRELPKWFLDIDGRRICDIQLAVLSAVVDDIHVILGHGFDEQTVDQAPIDGDDVNLHYYSGWRQHENGGSCYFALDQLDIDDDLLLVCGDVIFRHEMLENVVEQFEKEAFDDHSAATVIEGVQDEMTAVTWDEEQNIVDYGAIRGHQEAGIFILNQAHIETAKDILSENRDEWFPIIFPQIPTKPIKIAERDHAEINTPEHLQQARRKVARQWMVDRPGLNTD